MATLVKAKVQALGKEQVMMVGVISHLPYNLAMGTDFPLTEGWTQRKGMRTRLLRWWK